MAIQRFRTKPASKLTLEQKGAFILLVFLGSGGVVFGMQSFGANLSRPIQQQMAELYTEDTFYTQSEKEAKDLEAMKTRDTDGDGLSDYDEIYIYKTSPYLADSDGDGFSDKEELFSGNDPNCPRGKTCHSWLSTVDGANTQDNVATGFIQHLGDGNLLDAGSVQFETPEELELFLQALTLEQIRSALLTSGMPQEELDAIDDDTLRQLVSETLDDSQLSEEINALLNTTAQ